MASETLLMFGLTSAEELLIKRLTRSFEIKSESVNNVAFKDYPALFHENDICLVIVHVDHDRIRQVEKIRRIRKLLTVPVPMLLLLSSEQSSNIYRYIKAGADDYIVMPLDEGSFAMRFYVLLECGQAILQTRDGEKRGKEQNGDQDGSFSNEERGNKGRSYRDGGGMDLSYRDGDAWEMIMEYIQEGLSFFTPKSQFARRGVRPIFNKWKPVRKLATGADGTIWLVQEVGKSREAVAKIPHSPLLNINSLRAAAVLKRLIYHPNVVHLIEVVKDGGKFILIQEYVEGGTLPQLLASNISSTAKESLFLQLLSVVSYSHDHKIIHRDIKPDNIMVRADGRLKLLDFGSAKEISWRDCFASPEGTLNFMPPEQIEGRTSLASDVWALGVILYLLALNRLPFYQDNSCYPMDIEMDMVAVPPCKVRSDISSQLEEVIMRALEKDLEKRYRSASEFRDDLLKRLPDFGDGIYIP